MEPTEAVRILRSLYADDADLAASCHTNQAEVAAYVDAELNGLAAAALYPQIQEQLATCASCRLLYEEFQTLLKMEETGAAVWPPQQASFDFSYLQRATGSGATSVEQVVDQVLWRLTAWRGLVVEFSTGFLESLQAQALQPALLKSNDRELFTVSSPAIVDDLKVVVTARARRREPEHCSITVGVEIPSRGGWPNLGGIPVTLTIGGQPVETLATDDYGRVVFPSIARTALAQVGVAVLPPAS
jgi:hypothetical protein